MRLTVLFAGAVVLSAACATEAPPEMLGCETRFDCASGESCERSVCVPVTTSPAKTDASIYTRADGSVGRDYGFTDPTDSGQADSGVDLDAGVTDHGDQPLPDAGYDAGCPNPISVDNFPGYCTISAAVAAANNGATISVPAGTYAETVDIAKSLTLRGTGAALIQGSGAGSPLRVRAQNVTVDNFTVQAAGTIGVEFSGSGTLNALIVNGAAGLGITAGVSGTNVTISNSTINAVAEADPIQGFGIDIGPGASATILNTTVNDAAFAGILAYQATNLIVDNTSVLRSGRIGCGSDPSACGYGIIIDSGPAEIRNQTRVEDTASAGILVYLGSMNMSNSFVLNSGQRTDVWSPGVLVDNSTPVTITNSVISENQDEGVGCYINSDADCSGNTHVNNDVWTSCDSCDP